MPSRRSSLVLGAGLLLAAGAAAQLPPVPAPPGEVLEASRLPGRPGGLPLPLSDGDGFGAALAVVGDLDGDGRPELAVGAPGDDSGGAQRGAVWVLFRDAAGQLTRTVHIDGASGPLRDALDDGDLFGSAVAALGDLDGDGVPDLAVGAPGDDDGGSIIFPDPSVGAVWVLFMRRDGTPRAASKVSATAGGLLGRLNELNRFGSALAGLGDLGGDGHTELCVGAPGDSDFGIEAGALWMLSLAADGSVLGEVKSPISGATSQIGSSLANIGDLNGDGRDDLATAGRFFDPFTGGFEGYCLLGFPAADGSLQSTIELPLPPGVTADFGSAVAGLGDLDGDGFLDIAIGAATADAGGDDRGAVWIAFLLPAGFVKGYTLVSGADGAALPALSDGDVFGSALAGAGDDDHDGVPDLFVGASGDDGLGSDRGALWRLSLAGGIWTPLGHALPGSAGTPRLVGFGPLEPGTPVVLEVSAARPSTRAWLLLGARASPQPFFGGVLVPQPQSILGPSDTGPAGSLVMAAHWPSGVPAGTHVYAQAWIQDAAGPAGYAATNALAGTTP